MTITERAPAKINLALHVRARRPDGFHELETLFAFCRDGDDISITPAATDSFRLDGPHAGALAREKDNLVLRAARAFAARVAPVEPVAIGLTKRLPVASGIGGGSADAAATLRALARLADVSADDPRLMAIAAELGSDVPACLLGVTALGRGRGEALTAAEGLGDMPVLLVNPNVGVATGPVFAGWDGVDRGGIAPGDTLRQALTGRNDLEVSARRIAPVIGDVLERLAATGPVLCRMSGSGATCFALYWSVDERAQAARAIRTAEPGWWCLESELV